MKIILTDKILKLGEIGDVVEVSSGYARNFLIPKKKAMFASEDNLKYVESKKAEFAAASEDEIANAQAKADAVSPPAVEYAKGKLLAPKTKTGPIGINIFLKSGFGTGFLSGIEVSIDTS